MMIQQPHQFSDVDGQSDGVFDLPTYEAGNPGQDGVTSPGSFALKADVGGALMFASPDTPGMPAASEKTAWDFLPQGWSVEIVAPEACAHERAVWHELRRVGEGGDLPDRDVRAARPACVFQPSVSDDLSDLDGDRGRELDSHKSVVGSTRGV